MAYIGTGSNISKKGYSQSRISAANDFTYKGSVLVRNPNFSPFTQWRNAMWVHMIPLKLENQNSAGRGGSLSIGGENRPTFAFLAPTSMQEIVAHSWEGFDSIQSRLMGKLVGGAKLLNEGLALKNTMEQLAKKKSPVDSGQTMGMFDAAVKAAGRVSGTNVPKFKVDTPLRYMDSGRRKIQLEFLLMAESPQYDEGVRGHRGKNIIAGGVKESVTDIVRDLMMYSAPAMKQGNSIEYEFPYIWRLETYPSSFLLYQFCALTAVQPTWNAPYINGYPTNCALTLEFTDLSPLFRSTIKSGSAINVIDKSGVGGMSDSEWAATFEDLKTPINKKDTIKALLDARTKFKRAQAIHQSLTSGNEKSVLAYFKGQGTDVARRFLDSGVQQKIGAAFPKSMPGIVAKVPRI